MQVLASAKLASANHGQKTSIAKRCPRSKGAHGQKRSSMAINPYVTDINLILAFIASMLGFPAGIAVAYLAREELEDGRKHFVLMLHFLFTLAALIFLFSMKLHYIITFSLTMLALLLSITAYTIIRNRYIKFSAYYLIFGVSYFLSAGNTIIAVIMLSFIFLFGLPAGSVFADEQLFRKLRKQPLSINPAKKVKKVWARE